jgi:hypothetical protein
MGWKKDPFDPRDFSFHHVKRQLFAIPLTLPTKISWRSQMSNQKDQGEVGACVAFGILAYLEWLASQIYQRIDDLAERFIYSRRPNAPGEGMYIRDGLDIVLNEGCSPETLCPGKWYSPGINADNICDSPETTQAAIAYKIKSYARVHTVDEIKEALQNGPVVVGVLCTMAWITGSATLTGHIPDPKPGEGWVGGHCICITGYNDETGEFEFKNSWFLIPGIKPWGDGGYGYFHFSYIGNQLVTDDADAWVMVFQGGDVPPPPPDPWKKFLTCIKAAWKRLDVLAMLVCLQTLLHDKGWMLTASKTRTGGIRVLIEKTPET